MAALKKLRKLPSQRRKRRYQEQEQKLLTTKRSLARMKNLARKRSLARKKSLARKRLQDRRKALEKKRKTHERKKSWKAPARKKPLPKANKSIRPVRLPRRGYQMSCPLMFWCFNRWMKQHLAASKKNKLDVKSLRGGPSRMLSQKKGQPAAHRCPDFLWDSFKKIARKKKTKWVVPVAKKRKYYTDDEIFYKLANPSNVGDAKRKKPRMASGVRETRSHSLSKAQATGSGLQKAKH